MTQQDISNHMGEASQVAALTCTPPAGVDAPAFIMGYATALAERVAPLMDILARQAKIGGLREEKQAKLRDMRYEEAAALRDTERSEIAELEEAWEQERERSMKRDALLNPPPPPTENLIPVTGDSIADWMLSQNYVGGAPVGLLDFLLRFRDNPAVFLMTAPSAVHEGTRLQASNVRFSSLDELWESVFTHVSDGKMVAISTVASLPNGVTVGWAVWE